MHRGHAMSEGLVHDTGAGFRASVRVAFCFALAALLGTAAAASAWAQGASADAPRAAAALHALGNGNGIAHGAPFAVPPGLADGTKAQPDAIATAPGQSNAQPTLAAPATPASMPAAATAGRVLGALVAPGAAAAHLQVRTDAIATTAGTVRTVDFYGDGLINFAVGDASAPRGPAIAAAVRGGPEHDAPEVSMSATDASAIVDRAVNMSGIVESRAIAVHDGRITLVADPAQATYAVAMAATPQRADPPVSLLAGTDFRPAAVSARTEIRYDADRHGAAPVPVATTWTRSQAVLHGAIAAVPAATETLATASLALPLLQPGAGGPLSTLQTVLAPGAGAEQDDEGLAQAMAILAQVDTMVSRGVLAAEDVCQVAGGGNGLPGCDGSEPVDAIAALQPASGNGCRLNTIAGGLRLSCGGGSASPLAPANLTPARQPIDSTTTLLDLMEIWLQQPVDSGTPPLATTPGRLGILAEAAVGFDPTR